MCARGAGGRMGERILRRHSAGAPKGGARSNPVQGAARGRLDRASELCAASALDARAASQGPGQEWPRGKTLESRDGPGRGLRKSRQYSCRMGTSGDGA